MTPNDRIDADQIGKLARELLLELESFVESDGDTSYISIEEKESQHHIMAARKLIARARMMLNT